MSLKIYVTDDMYLIPWDTVSQSTKNNLTKDIIILKSTILFVRAF